MDTKQSNTKLSDQIRAAVEAIGISRNRISTDTKWNKEALSRFMSGTRGLSMESLDNLAEYLQLKIVLPSNKTE